MQFNDNLVYNNIDPKINNSLAENKKQKLIKYNKEIYHKFKKNQNQDSIRLRQLKMI